jgi:hypothetical protein
MKTYTLPVLSDWSLEGFIDFVYTVCPLQVTDSEDRTNYCYYLYRFNKKNYFLDNKFTSFHAEKYAVTYLISI